LSLNGNAWTTLRNPFQDLQVCVAVVPTILATSFSNRINYEQKLLLLTNSRLSSLAWRCFHHHHAFNRIRQTSFFVNIHQIRIE